MPFFIGLSHEIQIRYVEFWFFVVKIDMIQAKKTANLSFFY